MKIQIAFVSAAAVAGALLAAPLALAAQTNADAFMMKAIQGNLAEIKAGQLAEQKGATEGVREPSAKQQAEYEHLASLSGRQVDKAFVKGEVKDHNKDIAESRKEAKATNSRASTYASASLPVLHRHLRIAETLERKPGG